MILKTLMEFGVLLVGIMRESFASCLNFWFPTRKSVTGQVVLITGGGSGIGRLMCLEFAKKGAIVVILDIDKKAMESVAYEVRAIGAKCHIFDCDLSNRDLVYKIADQIKNQVGNVDILINNAGIVTGKKFMECPDALIEKTFQVNLLSHFWTVKAFLPAMVRRNHGHIVTISSSAGFIGVSGLADYCASKFAVYGFDESLRFELKKLKKSGVKTTCVCPYYINTGMFDGIKTKFPLLMPVLEPDYVVEKIMEAIQTDQEVLVMPRLNYSVPLARFFLPTKAFDLLGQFLGISESMDEFRGRQGKS
eukprot:Sdes_comp15704_c0_seq1m4738